MRKLTLILLLTFPIITFAQKVKNKTIRSLQFGSVEKFSVLKSDKSIRHGNYQKKLGKKLIATGSYNNGSRGVFNYYAYDGSSFLEYDFEKQQVVSYKELDNYEHYLDLETKTKADRLALPLFSRFEMMTFIAKVVEYPLAARKNGEIGRTKVAVKVAVNGQIISMSIFKSSHVLLDEEALRVVSKFPKEWKWLPAEKDGKVVESYVIIPIHFRLK